MGIDPQETLSLRMNKIYTFGDGFATGHIWPEWPQILQALLPGSMVINSAGIGAGPEWLVNRFVDELPEMNNSAVIFQWPQADRLDKIIEDQHWQDIADNDKIYYFNQYTKDTVKWWLSSKSTAVQVQEYHTNYIQAQQHTNRLKNYKILVENSLQNINCNYLFTSTAEQNNFSWLPQFRSVRQDQVQPSPPVHLAWLEQTILPNIDIIYNPQRLLFLKELVNQQQWIPYYYDRQYLWDNIILALNNSNT